MNLEMGHFSGRYLDDRFDPNSRLSLAQLARYSLMLAWRFLNLAIASRSI